MPVSEGCTKVKRLSKRSPRPKPPMPPTEEQEARNRKMFAAQLIALRIVQGISYATLLEGLGYLRPPQGRFLRLRPWIQKMYIAEAERRGRILEEKMANARFSLFQRYARIVGVRVAAAVHEPRRRPTPAQISRTIHHHRKVMRRKYGQRPRRRLVS